MSISVFFLADDTIQILYALLRMLKGTFRKFYSMTSKLSKISHNYNGVYR